MIEVTPVTSKRHQAEFIRLPWKIYRDYPNWVPPLRSSVKRILNLRSNPFWRKNTRRLLLARKNGEPVGRLAVFVNCAYDDLYGSRTGFFGFLEGIENEEVFAALFESGFDWLRRRGCEQVMGPFNPDIHNESGVLVEGFESRPFLMLPFNPVYYPIYLEAMGFRKAADFFSYCIDHAIVDPSGKLSRMTGRIARAYPVSVRAGNLKRFEEESAAIRDIYNEAMAGHWGFVPMDEDAFDFLAHDLKTIIDQDLVHIAEYEGKPVGFLLAVPNLNEALRWVKDGRLFPTGLLKILWHGRRIHTARIMLVGVKKAYQPLGIGGLLYDALIRTTADSRYDRFEMAWVMEENRMMNRAARFLGARLVKRYRIYRKEL